MKYPVRNEKYAHLGKNVLSVIQKALKEENPERKVAFADSIAYYMKVSYSTWHKEEVADELIRTELRVMTNGKLSSTPIDVSRKPLERADKVDYNRSDLDSRKQNFGNRAGGDTSLIGVPKKNKGNNGNNNKKQDNSRKGNFGTNGNSNNNKNNYSKKRF